MKSTFQIENHNIELGADCVEAVIHALPDINEHWNLYRTLADYPASAVRALVAQKEWICKETAAKLAADRAPEVRRALLHNVSGRQLLDDAQLRNLAENDDECAAIIASSLNCEGASDSLKIYLARHPDPRVRQNFLNSSNIPSKLLKELTKDSDIGVRESARSL